MVSFEGVVCLRNTSQSRRTKSAVLVYGDLGGIRVVWDLGDVLAGGVRTDDLAVEVRVDGGLVA